MEKKSFVVFFLGAILLLAFSSTDVAFADEDEWDDDEREYEREGFGEMEREQEREREHDDDDEGLALGGGISDAILYGTIAVIVGSIAYTGFKIYKAKRPKISAAR